jgi:uncharacterized protein DUF3108
MARAVELLTRYRVVAAAVLVSAILHAAVFVGMPPRIEAIDAGAAQVFSAQLAPLPTPPSPPKPPAPAPKRSAAPRPHVVRRAPPPPPPVPELLAAAKPAPDAGTFAAPVPEPAPAPARETTALAEPVIPWMPPPPAPAPPPDAFPMEGLPEHLAIDYELSSGILHAHAVYRWNRDGDSYRITGDGEAEGLFHLFLRGAIRQESTGTITSVGLRPERFTETRPDTPREGLEFDWPKHEVVFQRGDNRKTQALTDGTVDWLTMIFQLAHEPPPAGGDSMSLKVFTQRKLYDFRLNVLGIEQVEIPLGKVRALHLRHVDAGDGQSVDVWLGVDYHYLPVKLRYPAAKNRLTVEQSAVSITER